MTNHQAPELERLDWTEHTCGDFTVRLGLEKGVDDRDISRILDRVTGRYTGEQHLSESRSTVLPSCSGPLYDGMKIKGAGLAGGTVDFSRRHQKPYDLPYYDFEGNYSPDKSRAFQAAYSGGMSYQQAVNEYRVSRYLTDNGFDTYPPIGCGNLKKGGLTSWFCVINAPYQPYWQWNAPSFDRELVAEVPEFAGRAQVRLKDQGLVLVLYGVANANGRLIRKDFHSARFRDANDSFISRICYFLFDINFVLYTFAHPIFATGIPGWVEKAWCDYIGELCPGAPDLESVQTFKNTLAKLKLKGELGIEERMERIENDPVASIICREFMTKQEQRQYLQGDGA